ncbi:dihydroneopterin aldolase [Sporosarcina sp. 179-K 3D1 HS]|uniref:dihydroneopterin aldolase n=1 Tax=Sporosarcina sp. 179-K 3D1 HS TaxID=3232169 RepID=UPI0039A395EC
MDYIHLNEMQFFGYHGVLPEETRLGQRFRATVTLALDLSEAGKTDDLEKTVNYAEVYSICKSVVEGKPFKLIESVAEQIADEILYNFGDQVLGVRVMLVKPDPPIHGHYASVAVEITRGRFE